MLTDATAVGTIVTRNYLAHARVFARSLREYHPDARCVVVLADELEETKEPASDDFDLLTLGQLAIPDVRQLCFRSSPMPLNGRIKPHLLRYLLDAGNRRALLFDADVLIVGSLTPLCEAVAAHAVSLTPHLLTPCEGESGDAHELRILRSGVYNAGFVGVSESPGARRFLAWWADRTRAEAGHAIDRGVFYEQRWLDLLAGWSDDMHVVRDPGCNVAYWNLHERRVEVGTDGGVCVNGASGRFVHFSGFEPEGPSAVSRHAPALTRAAIGSAATLWDRYAALLRAAGHDHRRIRPNGLTHFDNGVLIPDAARRLHQELGDAARAFGDPFQAGGSGSFFEWLRQRGTGEDVDDELRHLLDAVGS